jgi:hypothetical protein
MKHILVNFYRTATRIFMNGDGSCFELLSQEGTTQGCPLAMAMYALSLVPLLKEVRLCRQVWYADDATGCDSFVKLRSWFDALLVKGPIYGYYPKPTKCILLTRPDRLTDANAAFKETGISASVDGSKDSGIEITTSGTRHLGAALGTTVFKDCYVKKKVDSWIRAVKQLAAISASEPHAAFAALTQCLQGQWTFLSRAMPGISALLQPLEDAIRLTLIPTLLRRSVTDLERDLLSLPARFGGMGIGKPTDDCKFAHQYSEHVSTPLVRLIMRQAVDLDPAELLGEIKQLRREVDKRSDERHKAKLAQILESPDLSPTLAQAIRNSSEKGASSWVTAAPNFDHGTILHKGQFVDACCIRYGWTLPDLPLKCPCGSSFSLQHSLDCHLGGLRTIRHNEVRDVLAQCMREAGHSLVTVEPELQPLSGEEFHYRSAIKDDEARSDIKCCGFWSNMRQAYFDVKVVSPLARSYAHLGPAQLYNLAEKEKIRQYRERILQVEHGDFNPLVSGGLAPLRLCSNV